MTQDKNPNSEPSETSDDSSVSQDPSLQNSEEIYEVYEYENKLDEDGKRTKELSSVSALPKDLPAQVPNKDKDTSHTNGASEGGIISKFMSLFRPKNDTSIRETIEEYIESEESVEQDTLLSIHEKTLLSNVLELHSIVASDVMVPRADIIGIPHNISKKDLYAQLAEKQYSRFPVFKDTLDNIVGLIHIKDILTKVARDEKYDMDKLIREIPIISPSMHVLDLLTQMRITRKHMVLVVDEFGGIDGLITIGDLIEAIVGEIDDEHNLEVQPDLTLQTDGSILADARYDIDEFEEIYGQILSAEERDENETLGGLAFFLAGQVPARGEVLTHNSGMIFEVEDADPRRVKRIRIRNIPQPNNANASNT